MLEAKAVFGRGSQRVTLESSGAGGEFTLAVTMDGAAPRAYQFDEVEKLTRFRQDMEHFLARTGWTLMEFSPERRRGGDRRTFPRLVERRRWWTDALNWLAPASPAPSKRRHRPSSHD